MPDLARAAAATLDIESCILDGEIVALDAAGQSQFRRPAGRFSGGQQADLLYFAFDLLHLDGRIRASFRSRSQTILAELLAQIDPESTLHLSEHIEARGSEVFAKACELGAEGIVSKVASSPYTAGRGNTWLKMKCALQQEFVVGGFTPPEKGGRGIGALLLGYYDGARLRYAGRCGTGFTEATHRTLRDRLDALVQKTSPYEKLPSEARRNVLWVKPKLSRR